MKYSSRIFIFTILFQVARCILNGIPSKFGQFPYMAGLMIKYTQTENCGGAVVSSRFILTSAHCICDKWSFKYYYALVGTTDLKYGGYKYELEKSICHELFIPKVLANDIGLVKTTKAIQFNFDVQFITLNNEEINEGQWLIATGWGCTSRWKEEFPEILRYSILEVISKTECEDIFWNSVEFRFICTKASDFTGMCSGDSGGPVTHNGKLAGISFGVSDGGPDLFIKIADFRPWIEALIYQHEVDESGNHDLKGYMFNYTYNYVNDFKIKESRK